MNFSIQNILETERLILILLQESDFEELYQVASDPKVWEQHPNKDRWKRDVFRVFFDGALQSQGAFKIVEKSTGKIIGSTRFYDYNKENNSILIGYTFYGTDYWGKGYNQSVKKLMLDYIFAFVDIVYLHVGAGNIRSQIAIGRLGAQKIAEEEIPYFGEAPKLNFVYRIEKEFWLNRKPLNMDELQLLNNLKAIEDRIRLSCIRCNRNPEDVKLLLATKTVSPDRIAIALRSGHTLIAENKIQELKEKYEALKSVPHTNHFIGHLQTNKIKDVLKYEVACIQSVDRIDLAEKLNQRLATENKFIDILIQVNTSDEESKFGVHPEHAIELVRQVALLDRIRIKGLMTIGLFSADDDKVRQCFRLLKNLQQEIIHQNIPRVEMKELSMGMSGDLEIAIEEGSTIIRVGTAIFGKRDTPDSFYWNEKGN